MENQNDMGQNMMQNEAPMQQNSTPTPPPMSEEKVREGKKILYLYL